MPRLLAKLAFAGLGRRRLQAILTVLVVATATAAFAIALGVSSVAERPFERTFEATRGAHVTATTFSGRLSGPGVSGPGSSFDGLFTGPAAAELMGKFVTPFEADMKSSFSGNPQVDHLTGTLAGMFVGKKD